MNKANFKWALITRDKAKRDRPKIEMILPGVVDTYWGWTDKEIIMYGSRKPIRMPPSSFLEWADNY